ncbi:hypothetical protein HS141_12925 [Cetobacterium somerae]|uniref:hypothetical protein n=1 Tax=Cetobacterium somerae TaxID=188913 RepID=UPI00211EE5A8|nr:hypothetical protein [Cetobacterium somerae]MCQ9627827.1 hypothetical protein [Cetobacterium somerae]
MKKINITNRLKEQLQEKGKKEEIEMIDNSIKEEELKDILDLDEINSISEDQELVNFLKESTVKLFNIQAKSVVLIGEVLTNVFEKLAKQGSQEGVYEKWLKLNNFNKQTALRYRRRYFVYNQVNIENKNVVLTLPQNIIDIMYEHKEHIKLLNDGVSKKDLINSINNLKIEDKREYSNFIEFDFKNYKNIFFDFDKKIESLKEKEKIELQKHLKKIEEILNKD